MGPGGSFGGPGGGGGGPGGPGGPGPGGPGPGGSGENVSRQSRVLTKNLVRAVTLAVGNNILSTSNICAHSDCPPCTGVCQIINNLSLMSIFDIAHLTIMGSG